MALEQSGATSRWASQREGLPGRPHARDIQSARFIGGLRGVPSERSTFLRGGARSRRKYGAPSLRGDMRVRQDGKTNALDTRSAG